MSKRRCKNFMCMAWGSHNIVEVEEMGDILALAGLDFSEQVDTLLEIYPITREEEEAQLASFEEEHAVRMLIDPGYRTEIARITELGKQAVRNARKRSG